MDTVVWSTLAMCMVPTADTVKEHKYVTTAGRVKFRIGESGTIAFLAPVQVSLPQGSYILRAKIVREAPNLAGLSIQLRRARLGNGAVDTLLSCSSVQTGSVQNNIRSSDSSVKNMKVDLDTFFYWAQVTLVNNTPATADTIDSVLGVSLIRSE